MRSVSFEKLLQKSIQRAVLILFKPFTLKKWFLLLFIAFMAGAINSGGNGGSGGGGSSQTDRSQTSRSWTGDSEVYAQETQETSYGTWADETTSPAGNFSARGFTAGGTAEDPGATAPTRARGNDAPSFNEIKRAFKGFAASPLGAVVVTVGALVLIAFFLAFTWLGARFRFIWFDSVVKNDASVKAPFIKYAPQGNSLFRFFVVMGLLSLMCIGLLAWWGYSGLTASGIMNQATATQDAVGVPNIHWGTLIGSLLPVVLLFILLFVILAVVALFVDHFVVAIMALEGCCFTAGWRKFTAVLKQNTKDIFLFTLLVFGLSIAATIIMVIAMWILILVGLLAGGLLFGLLYLITVGLLKLKIVFGILAVLIGVPLGAAAICVLISIPLPFAVFYRCFSLYFISSLGCGYAPLPLEEAIASPAPPAPA